MNKREFESLHNLVSNNSSLIDYNYIMTVLTCYAAGDFDGAKNLIEEYGPGKFFTRCYELFEIQGAWRSTTNKYMNFVGLVLTYHKEVFLPKEVNGRQAKEVSDILLH